MIELKTDQELIDIAVKEILALRDITKTTGMITRRSQNAVLGRLTDELLAKVAVELAQKEHQ